MDIPSVKTPVPVLVSPPGPLNEPLNVVELLLPPVIRLDESVTLPPTTDPPPLESDPIVSVPPLIVKPTPATFARLIADKSPQAVPPFSVTNPPLMLRLPAKVPGLAELLSCSVPLPIFVNVAVVTEPATGPAHVKLNDCVSMVPPPAATVMPRSAFVMLFVAPICHVPPSSVTCPGCSPSAAGTL